MRPVMTFGLAVVLTSVLTSPGLAVSSSEQAREANGLNRAESPGQTTTPWSSSMSSPNTPSHDGNSQLGTKQRNSADARNQAGGAMSWSSANGSVNAPSHEADRQLGQRDSANPAATNPGCGGAC
jgi:hypothetical protein